MPDADDSQKVEQRDDIVIPETPEQLMMKIKMKEMITQ